MANQLRKKRKLEKIRNSSTELLDIEETDDISEANFEYLPDLVLNKIFSYLNFEDRYNAAFVCHRWYIISRSPVLWTKLHLKVKSSLHLLRSLFMFPPCVSYLSIYCDCFDKYHSLWLPDILTRLHERCPSVKSVIIENVFFAKRFCNARLTTDHILVNSIHPEQKHEYTPRCTKECCSEKTNRDKYVPQNRPRELSVFSLRYARGFMSHLSSQISPFLPNVKVLDLTCSVTIKFAAILFFQKLQYLEELYLVECIIMNSALENLLKNLKNLKVLDLEGSVRIDDDSFVILKKHGQFLEQLFLGNTYIRTVSVGEDVFPHLQRICFKNLMIIDNDFSHFMTEMPNLKYIDVSFCDFLALQKLSSEAVIYKKEFICSSDGERTAVCHHFKEKYM